MPSCRLVLAGLALSLWVAGCAPGPTPTPTPLPSPTPQPPTAVARARPTATLDPFAAVDSAKLPGVVVPAGATLVSFTAASAGADAQAEYHMPGVEVDAVTKWFREQMTKAGWGQPEDVDGALQFVHPTELAARTAREGIRRHALILLTKAEDGVDIVLNVEEPD